MIYLPRERERPNDRNVNAKLNGILLLGTDGEEVEGGRKETQLPLLGLCA